ncbi:MAG: sulfotransferase family protein [Nitrososphaera sp.]
MNVLGVGLSKTGTFSLHTALQKLGLNALHYDTQRLNRVLDGSDLSPDFRIYDDVDAVTDLPAAAFYDELLQAYPKAKAVLTIRDVDAWWESIEKHFNRHYRLPAFNPFKRQDRIFRTSLRNYVYGSTRATEFLYKKRYLEHNARVQTQVPAHRLLVMDITAGEGWDKLAPFLGLPVPAIPFPHENKAALAYSHA